MDTKHSVDLYFQAIGCLERDARNMETLFLHGRKYVTIPDGFEFGGYIDLCCSDIRYLPAGLHIYQGKIRHSSCLALSGSQIEDIPEDLQVDALYLDYTKVKSLPATQNKFEYLNLRKSAIETLPEGMEVGELCLEYTGNVQLPDGLKVFGNLRLKGSQILSLPKGMYVGGCLDIRDTGIQDIPSDAVIKGLILK